MNEESLNLNTVTSEDHLDAMFVILDEMSNKVEETSKKEIWVCEWDNVHGDMIFFK